MTLQTLLNLFATVSLLLERRFYSSRGEISRYKGLNWMIKLDVLGNFGLIMSDLALVRVKLHVAKLSSSDRYTKQLAVSRITQPAIYSIFLKAVDLS